MRARLGFRLLLVLLTGLLGTACGVRPTGVIGAGEPAVAQQAVPQTTVYLARNGRLVPVRRVALPGAPQAALYDLWYSGPTQDEAAAGMWSPFGELAVYGIKVRDGILTVDYGWEGTMTRLLKAQVVCSGTAQPDVRGVRMAVWRFTGPGPDQPSLDLRHPPPGASVTVSRPKKCSDYAGLMSP